MRAEAKLSLCLGNLGYIKAMLDIGLTFDHGLKRDASAHSACEDE